MKHECPGTRFWKERSCGDARICTPLDALHASVARLDELPRGLDDNQLTGPSYCSDWTMADVLSHLGSGMVITQRGLADTLARDTRLL